MIPVAAVVTLAAVVPPAATVSSHHRRGCNTDRCDHGADAKWRHRHPFHDVAVAHYTVDSTCYHEGSITASESAPFVGEVANNTLPLGTRIRLDSPAFGRRHFVVLDRIGEGSELDIYGPSEAACLAYGRQTRGFSVIVRRR